MIHRVNDCFGITICPPFLKHIELWVCFSGVGEHSHPGQHVEIVPIFGKAIFKRQDRSLLINNKKWFKSFSIPAGWAHSFILKSYMLIFLSVSDKSPADNFYVIE
jgi:hypothetical protein